MCYQVLPPFVRMSVTHTELPGKFHTWDLLLLVEVGGLWCRCGRFLLRVEDQNCPYCIRPQAIHAKIWQMESIVWFLIMTSHHDQ